MSITIERQFMQLTKAALDMKKPFRLQRDEGWQYSTGLNKDTKRVFVWQTLADAEAHIAKQENYDPLGVHAGDYFIDGPAEI